LCDQGIESLDFGIISQEFEPYVKEPKKFAIWSQEFFMYIATRIKSQSKYQEAKRIQAADLQDSVRRF